MMIAEDGGTLWEWALAIAALLVLSIAWARLSTCRAFEYQGGVVFRFGRYLAIRGPGLYFLIRSLIRDRRSIFEW